MHRFRYADATLATSWLAPDGLHPLPQEVAERLGAEAVVALDEHVALLSPRGLARLDPDPRDDAAQAAQGRLSWERQRATRPARMEEEATRDGEAPGGQAELALIDGRGETVPFGDDMTLVGRHPGCDVVLDDTRVSAFHCILQRSAGGVRVIDLGSTNGTFVSGARVREAHIVRPARLVVGGTALAFIAPRSTEHRTPLPSPAMRRIEATLGRIATARAPVLVQGESGVGKDGVAQALHTSSGRPGRLVVLNAAVITPTLAASELFGHVRGAFTGAESDRPGAFVSADRGTLFLDEVGDLSLEVQAELLRVVERGVVRPVGATSEVEVDVRLVTATHKNLAAEVRAGRFREDLFHRISVLPVEIPPLRDRPEDIDALADHFLANEEPPRRLSPAARARLVAHAWPGNIRQLSNVLKRSCVFTDHEELEAADLAFGAAPPPMTSFDDLIHDLVVATYHATDRNAAETARRLGLQRAVVFRHVEMSTRDRRRRKHRRAEA